MKEEMSLLKYRIRQNGLDFQPECFTEVIELGVFGVLSPQVKPIGSPVASLDEARKAIEHHINKSIANQTVYHQYP